MQEDLDSQELCLRLWRSRKFDKSTDKALTKFSPALERHVLACVHENLSQNVQELRDHPDVWPVSSGTAHVTYFGSHLSTCLAMQRNAAMMRHSTRKEIRFLEALTLQMHEKHTT